MFMSPFLVSLSVTHTHTRLVFSELLTGLRDAESPAQSHTELSTPIPVLGICPTSA